MFNKIKKYIQKKYKLHKKLKKIKDKNLKKSKNKQSYQFKLNFKNKNTNNKRNTIIIIIIIIIWIILLYNSSFFKVNKIEILREDPRSSINIAYLSIWNIKWKNIFSLNKNNLKNKLKNYQNNINYISITKLYPHTIKIKIWSYKEIYNTIINNKTYLLLTNWSVVPINKINKNLLTININNNKIGNFIDYKQIVKKEKLDKIIYIENKLKKNLLTNKIISIDFFPIQREVHIILKNKTRIIFDINQNLNWIDKQIKKIIIFNKQYHNINKNDIIYIDLRIKYKLYYCDIEKKYDCYNNLKRIYSIKK